MVAAACRDAGLEPILSGVHTVPTHTPEQAIADAEIVVGLGRCVVEAMAGRRAAYVYVLPGGDGWVTPERYSALEADGFAGTASDVVIDRARLAADLAGWDPQMGPRNRQLADDHHDVAAHAAELVAPAARPAGRRPRAAAASRRAGAAGPPSVAVVVALRRGLGGEPRAAGRARARGVREPAGT
jgi:hypothetical protein